MEGKSNAAVGSGQTETYKAIGTGSPQLGGTWRYVAPAGKRISSIMVVFYEADGYLAYDSKTGKLRLAVSYNARNWGEWIDYTHRIIKATDTEVEFNTYTTPHNYVRGAIASTEALISLY